MIELKVDENRLADELEAAIANSEAWWADTPDRYKLRIGACGLTTGAVVNHLLDRGFDARQMVTNPELEWDKEFRHIVSVVEPKGGDPWIIEAAYSQLLDPVGLRWGYETFSGTEAFPDERVIYFRFSERSLIANWLADVATTFQRRNTYPTTDDCLRHPIGLGPLAFAPRSEILEVYSRMWDLGRYEPWIPSDEMAAAGKAAAPYISPKTIRVLH